MLTFSLQSGSNGNSIYVEAGGVGLLFDAGINAKAARARMQAHGRDIRDVRGLIISHEHNDHIRCAGVFQRRFGIPIYVNPMTISANECPLGKLRDVRFFMTGGTLEFGPVRVHTIPTPHDARDPVCFIVEHESKRLAILTDLGHPFSRLGEILAEVDAAYLESNYDPHLLETGPYPVRLKQRIRGPAGHLSNEESADTVRRHVGGRLAWLALAHLSEQNNTADLARAAQWRHVGKTLDVRIASRYGVSDAWTV